MPRQQMAEQAERVDSRAALVLVQHVALAGSDAAALNHIDDKLVSSARSTNAQETQKCVPGTRHTTRDTLQNNEITCAPPPPATAHPTYLKP